MKHPASALEDAIEWTACLRSGEVQAHEQQAFDAWLAADPAHAQAWNKVQRHLGSTFAPLNSGPDSQVRRVLQSPDPQRRRLLRGALALGGMGLGATLLGRQSGLFDELGADLHTATAERRRFTLADGSALLLDARSAVDIQFGASERHLRLRSGKLIVEVSDDPRPFVVATPHGYIRATGARFMVALQGDATHVWGMQSSVCISLAQGTCQWLKSAHGARLDLAGIHPLAANRSGETSWEDGRLSVNDWSLGEVIEALQPYRRGVLRVSAHAAQLRVSGVFSLDNSERALASLEQTMPLQIKHYLGFWTQIERRS